MSGSLNNNVLHQDYIFSERSEIEFGVRGLLLLHGVLERAILVSKIMIVVIPFMIVLSRLLYLYVSQITRSKIISPIFSPNAFHNGQIFASCILIVSSFRAEYVQCLDLIHVTSRHTHSMHTSFSERFVYLTSSIP